jgi:sugar O-acyltransferase (sialic acid O-acetyltransferase NeuD family)
MTEDLLVIGAGGSAGGICWMLQDINRHGERWRLRGFLDDDATRHGSCIWNAPVLGPLADLARFPAAKVVIAMAHYRRPQIRTEIADRLGLSRDRYATLVHPSADVSPDVVLGAGCLVFRSAFIGDGARLGDHVFISPRALVSHHVVVEDGATLAIGAMLSGGSTLGPGAYAGAGSIVKDGVRIGAGAVLAAGSVVLRDVAAGATVIGNPARAVTGRARRPST